MGRVGGQRSVKAPAGSMCTWRSTISRDRLLRSPTRRRAVSVEAFLRAAVAYYAGLGVTVREVLTDNGAGYRARSFAATCAKLGLKHRRTRPCTPRTNGRAGSSSRARCASGPTHVPTAPPRSASCTAALATRLQLAPTHASLAGQPPTSRLGLSRNNLLRLHT